MTNVITHFFSLAFFAFETRTAKTWTAPAFGNDSARRPNAGNTGLTDRQYKGSGREALHFISDLSPRAV
jgi:hypothetical protein